ncbi:MAG: sodium:solute symporter family protein [Bacteroidales bacterium]|nr:sodium:solute symporter family protein [Bacteroidales bacterium]MDD4771593.1 sodium:solute symporter family protein [Bacteroidales bacterium]
MHWIDVSILVTYFLGMLAIGFWFHRKNSTTEDYYVGGRGMSKWHLGLSVVATDVGGGFSIGLGGLGFAMGLSGSWILFTGLIGAWLTAVVLIPKVHKLGVSQTLQTFPALLKHHYGGKVAFLAALISAIGYMGFTASQILAGAKLSAATFTDVSIQEAILLMGAVAVLYTALGGLKAVIYTDTIQWAVLLAGLTFVGLPFAIDRLGGWQEIRPYISDDFLRLDQVSFSTLINWAFSIIPIWFIGMTLYQRIYAAKSEKEAKQAWFIAGLFEYPVMAFLGVALGILAKVSFDSGLLPTASLSMIDPESAMPMMLKQVLPIGALGLIMAAYFSAILSTADSCLMASSGNICLDLFSFRKQKKALRMSQIMTFVIGFVAVLLAMFIPSVLDLMLMSYAFMVSGLTAPVLGILWYKKPSPRAALSAMSMGSLCLLILQLLGTELPMGLDPVVPGLLISIVVFGIVQRAETISA